MSESHSDVGYKSYWITWGLLLAMTGVMLATDALPVSRTLLIVLLMIAMTIKAVLIGGQFMHLRFERPALVLAVVGTIVFLSVFLFILIRFDGLRILRMVQP